MTLRGQLGKVQRGRVGGWGMRSDRPGRPVELFAWANGRFLGRVLADRHRSDLAPNGIGDGHHAFEIQLPPELADGRAHELRITDCDGQPLPGTPQEISSTDCDRRVLPTDSIAPTDDVVMLGIAKNEAPYIEEWVAHHYGIGFRRFVVYDNDSTDGTGARLARNPRLKGLVEVVPWPLAAYQDQATIGPQQPAYRHAMGRLGGEGWVAVMDIDEFLVLKQDASVQAMLRRYRDLAALAIHWKVFGASGLADDDGRLVTERFHHAHPSDMVKTIARLDLLEQMYVHHHITRDRVGASELRHPLYDPHALKQPSYRAVQINHYFTKSRQEWEEKRYRGRSDRPADAPGFVRDNGQFHRADESIEYDREIDHHAATTRAALALLFPDHPQAPRGG
ncbi:glycosyl transferase family 2 [Stella humosa]|uniref:Glycosyl transferase family 2 n=2 Tax=Stella humosa TaxID=94 RepID=A0A3N1M1M3_9PROT|nr:glycosyl transferase family 2 [Stella humosa]BBK31164.1 hypothetical protein STHU_17980 [Stella humosa]